MPRRKVVPLVSVDAKDQAVPSLEYLHALIRDGVEESLTLEYKAAGALARTDPSRAEVTKDVSAMANSAGGRLIYGMREFSDKTRRHRPETVDPIDRQAISREWLEQVIGNIRPRVPDVVIHPVAVGDDRSVVYVVDVPKADTAHQAADKRYYRRYNFASVPMDDHEIRDVMGRAQHPRIELSVEIQLETVTYQPPLYTPFESPRTVDECKLHVLIENTRLRLARFVNGVVKVPQLLVKEEERRHRRIELLDARSYVVFDFNNTRRDVVDVKSEGLSFRTIEGPSWHDPVLPGNRRRVLTVPLDRVTWLATPLGSLQWRINADNAPSATGSISIGDIPVNDRRVRPK